MASLDPGAARFVAKDAERIRLYHRIGDALPRRAGRAMPIRWARRQYFDKTIAVTVDLVANRLSNDILRFDNLLACSNSATRNKCRAFDLIEYFTNFERSPVLMQNSAIGRCRGLLPNPRRRSELPTSHGKIGIIDK